jgi:hypothetical protein
MNKKITTAGVAALSAAVLFTGCGSINGNATLATLNTGDGTKETVTLGYGNFAARYQQSMYDQYLIAYYGESMWTSDMSGSGKTLQEDTKEGVLEDIEEQYLAKLHAADYGVELSEEQKTAIADAAKQFMADNSEESLKVMGATEEYVKQYLENRTYYYLVSEAAKKAADADISEDDCWMRSFSYVLFETTGQQGEDGALVELSDDEIAEIKTQAKTLSTAEDFDAELEAQEKTASTYSYLKGETEDSSMDMAIINAAEKLKEGEVSSVIEVEGVGFYVIRLNSDHDADASDNKRSSLQNDAFTALMDSWKEAVTWEVDEKAWDKVKFDTLFKAPETEEEATEETTEESSDDTTTVTSESTAEETETTDEN